jgi:hypothetical protein
VLSFWRIYCRLVDLKKLVSDRQNVFMITGGKGVWFVCLWKGDGRRKGIMS